MNRRHKTISRGGSQPRVAYLRLQVKPISSIRSEDAWMDGICGGNTSREYFLHANVKMGSLFCGQARSTRAESRTRTRVNTQKAHADTTNAHEENKQTCIIRLHERTNRDHRWVQASSAHVRHMHKPTHRKSIHKAAIQSMEVL